MSQIDPITARPVACPFLGTVDEERTRYLSPAEAHRCRAGSEVRTIDLSFQGQYCLSSEYPTCDRYHASIAEANGPEPIAVEPESEPIAAESEPLAASAEAAGCPYLGLPDDARTRFSFPAQAHRCHAGLKPATIEPAHQRTYCLSSEYPTCSRYRTPKAATNGRDRPRLSVNTAQAAEAEASAEADGVSQPPPTRPAREFAYAAGFAYEPESTPTASSPYEPEPAPIVASAYEPKPTQAEAQPATEQDEQPRAADPPEPVVAQEELAPPTVESAPEVTRPMRDLVGVFPSTVPTTVSASSASAANGSDPVSRELLDNELFAKVPPKEFEATPPPSTAWRKATAVSVMMSILPPMDPSATPSPVKPALAAAVMATIPPTDIEPTAQAQIAVADSAPEARAQAQIAVADNAPEAQAQAQIAVADNAPEAQVQAPEAEPVADSPAAVAEPEPEPQLVPAMAFGGATPVAATRARLPATAPLAAPPTVVRLSRWPDDTTNQTVTGEASRSPAKKRRGRGRVLLFLVVLVLVAAGIALYGAYASGSLDRWLPVSTVRGTTALATATPAAAPAPVIAVTPPLIPKR